jgi:hypothetical protein
VSLQILGLVDRDDECKGRAAPKLAVELDTAAVSSSHRVDDGETETGTTRPSAIPVASFEA